MKVVILTPIPFWHPGTMEFIQWLEKSGISVVTIDAWSLSVYSDGVFKTNKVAKVLPGFLKRIYQRLFRKRFLRSYVTDADIVDIQWCGHYYSRYMSFISKLNQNIIATPFGSDVLRATDSEREIQKRIFDVAKFIVLSKNWQDKFIEFFPDTEKKIRNNQFGSGRYDQILELWDAEMKKDLRRKFGISDEHIAITIGYSANPVQQHLKILDVIKMINTDWLDRITLIFPLTYGLEKNSEYYLQLIREIKDSGIHSILFEERLSDTELCESRIISDVMLNMQTTDSQASSIKEGFAARNFLLVGDWLPYEFYQDKSVYYQTCNFENLKDRLEDVLKNFETYREKSADNYDKVKEFASWKFIMGNFIKTYKETLNERG